MCRGEHAALLEMRVEMSNIGRQHDPATPGLNTHGLQTFRMTTDQMNRQTRSKVFAPVMEFHAVLKHSADHRRYVVEFKWCSQHFVAHAPARPVGQLAVLQMEFCVRKEPIISGVVVVHM